METPTAVHHTMAGRLSSSVIFRSALAAHASLSAASLISSAVRSSQLEQLPNSSQHRHPSRTNSDCHPPTRDVASMCVVLPWLDQLNSVIANLYISGGIKKCGCSPITNMQQQQQQQHSNVVTMVQIGDDVSFENPIVSYAGYGEVENAFRGRFHLHPQNDVKTVLECVGVEASTDSICGGSGTGGAGVDQSPSQQLSHLPNPLTGISSSQSPPTVKVTYRLNQQYGTYFSVHSLLLVTIQLRRGCSSEVRKITHEQKLGTVPLATSRFTTRAANTVAVAVTAHTGLAAVALAKVADRVILASATGTEMNASVVSSGVMSDSLHVSSPVVAEVVRIEELWNGVQLLQFAPIHWSRRLNGLVASGAATIFLSL